MSPTRMQFRLRSLALMVACCAVGLALAPTGRESLAVVPIAGLVGAWFFPIATLVPFGVVVILGAMVEVGLGWPLERGYYAGIALMLTVLIWPRRTNRHRRRRFGGLAIGYALLLLLYLVPWSTRKPFLRDLDAIKPGMTMAEVLQRMGHYDLGTGWVIPGAAPEVTLLSQARSLTQGRIIFRHSNDPAFNADWGIVDIVAGKVSNVEFSPD